MIRRIQEKMIFSSLFKRKTIILYGARQVGKTTLVTRVLKDYSDITLFLNADENETRALLTNPTAARLRPVIGRYRILVIDEAQRIPEAGLTLKIIHDAFPDLQLIATGSSAINLAAKISEPMTGRKLEFFLHPLSFEEMVSVHGYLEEKRLIQHRMIFGYYPDIVVNQGSEIKLLKSLASSFLYKDLLMIDQIKKPAFLEKILLALALQIGQEVSFSELSQLLEIDKNTVDKYINLLEKAYVIFKLNGLNRNARNEIKKGKKIYFYDNGVRNAVLGNFQTIDSRSDKGALWENFVISERQKLLINHGIDFKSYFWRTIQQQEIDYIEEINGRLAAFEIKWNPRSKAAPSKTFTKAYPDSTFTIINNDNPNDFLLSDEGFFEHYEV